MNNSDSKTLNAIRLHLILLNEGGEAVRFKLVKIIERSSTVKDYLIRHRRNSSPFLKGFRRTLDKYSSDTLIPNDLNDFDISGCYSIGRTLLNLQGNDLKPFEDIIKLRNKYYGHLNFISIEDGEYGTVLNELKSIIQTLTQSDLNLQQEINNRINQIEKIESLSHLNANDWNNLNEIIIDLLLNNKDMFLMITQQNKDLKDFIDNFPSMQLDLTNSINKELLKLTHIIQSQSLTQNEIDHIANSVSNQLNIDNLKLSFVETLRPQLDLLRDNTKSDINQSNEELKSSLRKILKLLRFFLPAICIGLFLEKL